MEDKLNEYRLRKRRQEKIEKLKEKFLKMVSFEGLVNKTKNEDVAVKMDESDNVSEIKDTESICSSTPDDVEEPITGKRSYLTYCTYLLYFLIWLTLYAIAIEIRFGIVFFMISLLIAVCVNTRTRPKKPGEASAYSVFNKDCESIDGTFKAEMFEKQLGIRKL